jgi:hypothetical protein
MLADRLGMKREPWWFPYSEQGTRLVRAALELRGRRGPGALISAARRYFGGGS